MEQRFELSEIEPAPPLVRSESVSSFIVHDDVDDESASLFRQPQTIISQEPSGVLSQDGLYNLIREEDHAKITFYRTIISYKLVNQCYEHYYNLRPLAYAAATNAHRRVFQALFLCGADPDFKEEPKQETCCEWFLSLYQRPKQKEKIQSAQNQIRQLLQEEKEQERQCYLLRVLRNLRERDPQCRLTWRTGVTGYAKERGVRLRSSPEYHIQIIE